MCSQTHNDAEDLLNKFLIYRAADTIDLRGDLALEKRLFGEMLTYFGLRYYLEATLEYARCFGLVEAQEEIKEGHDSVIDLIQDTVADLESLGFESRTV
jgi:hypothetical protein